MASPRKSASASSEPPEDNEILTPNSRKSCESVYSIASSRYSANILYRSKIGGNRAKTVSNMRQPSIIPASSEVRQRVLSARRLRIKTYQNQLADAHNRIAELSAELRLLTTLHKRQDNALAKYESSNAELPQLLHSHAEELRMWQCKYRTLQSAHKELENKLKQKEAIILSLSDQNKVLSQLNRDKGLEERQRLTDKLLAMEARLQEKDNDMKLLARKMQLEIRNCKQQLVNEQKRTKEALQKVEKLRYEFSSYEKLEEADGNRRLPAINPTKIMATHVSDLESSNSKKIRSPRELSGLGATAVGSGASSPLCSAREEATELVKGTNALTLESCGNEIHCDSSEHLTLNSSSVSNSVLNSTHTVRSVYDNTSAKMKKPTRLDTASDSTERNVNNSEDGSEDAIHANTNHENILEDSVNDLRNEPRTEVEDSLKLKSLNRQCIENYIDETEHKLATVCRDLLSTFAKASSQIDEKKQKYCNLTTTSATATATAVSSNSTTVSRRSTGYAEVYESDGKQTLPSSPKVVKQRFQEDILCLRKQISNDYKEREAFLDNFCRQAANSALRDGTVTQKRTNLPADDDHNTAVDNNNRRSRLLSALKAIESDSKQNRRN